MRKAKRRPSGLDMFLSESLAEDKDFRSKFLAEARKLPARSRRRVLKHLTGEPLPSK